MKAKEKRAANIPSLQGLLLVKSKGTEKMKMYKRVFMELSVLFIKYFAVK